MLLEYVCRKQALEADAIKNKSTLALEQRERTTRLNEIKRITESLNETCHVSCFLVVRIGSKGARRPFFVIDTCFIFGLVLCNCLQSCVDYS